MMLVVIDLDVTLRKFQGKSPGIKFRELGSQRDEQIAFHQELLHHTQAGDTAHRQGMVIGNCSFAAGGSQYRGMNRLRQFPHRLGRAPMKNSRAKNDDRPAALLNLSRSLGELFRGRCWRMA